MTDVLAPCPGRVIPLADVPDPVFSGQMMGPGVGIEPADGETTVIAPIAGSVLKVLPHAFVIVGEDGLGVLVHLGINTVRLNGEGFEVLAQQGSKVEAGAAMIRWNPAAISGPDISTVIPIVAMERPADSIVSDAVGTDVAPGEVLFSA